MVYRFFVAMLFNFLVFPFVAMYSFSLQYPAARFAIDWPTWGQGVAVVTFGWVLFLLPGLLPFIGRRYYGWVARKVGLVALFDAIRVAYARTRDSLKWLHLRIRTSVANLSLKSDAVSRLRTRFQRAPSSSAKPDVSATPLQQIDEPKKTISGADLRAATADQLTKARAAIADTPKQIAKAKDMFSTLKQRFTPDELQRTIDLNQYTLMTFAHVKTMLQDLLHSVELPQEDRQFVSSVIDAIPEPPSPSAVITPPPSAAFIYPEERRSRLRSDAARKKISIRDADFELAADGDLERALLIVRGLVMSGISRPSTLDDPIDEAMIGLTAHGITA